MHRCPGIAARVALRASALQAVAYGGIRVESGLEKGTGWWVMGRVRLTVSVRVMFRASL